MHCVVILMYLRDDILVLNILNKTHYYVKFFITKSLCRKYVKTVKLCQRSIIINVPIAPAVLRIV